MLELLHAWSRFRLFVTVWFVRLAWAPVLAWGLYDAARLALGIVPLAEVPDAEEDAAARVVAGGVIFLLWFFGVRTFGPLTMNRGGRLERDG